MVVDPNRDPDAANIHLAGLRNIIGLRGGYDGLPMSLVQWIILYARISAPNSSPDVR